MEIEVKRLLMEQGPDPNADMVLDYNTLIHTEMKLSKTTSHNFNFNKFQL